MLEIHAEDVCNDTYGRVRMFQALTLKRPDGIPIPSERTVYRVMEKIGLSHRPKRNPKGITKADREARKSDDLLKKFHIKKLLKMRDRYHRNQSKRWKTLCFGNLRLF